MAGTAHRGVIIDVLVSSAQVCVIVVLGFCGAADSAFRRLAVERIQTAVESLLPGSFRLPVRIGFTGLVARGRCPGS